MHLQPRIVIGDRPLGLIDRVVETGEPEPVIGSGGQRPVGDLHIFRRAIRIAAHHPQPRAQQTHLAVVRAQRYRLVDVRRGEQQLAVGKPRLAAQKHVPAHGRGHRHRLVEIGEPFGIVPLRQEHRRAPAEPFRIGRHGRRVGQIEFLARGRPGAAWRQSEHRTALIRHVHLMVRVRDEHAVREKEIEPDQHVAVDPDIGDVEFGFRHDLAAEVDRVERRDPGGELFRAEAAIVANLPHTRTRRRDPRALGRGKRHDRGLGPRIEHRAHLHAVDQHGADRMRLPWPTVAAFEWDRRERLARGPIGERDIVAALDLHQPDRAVRQVVFDVDQPQDVLTEQPRRTRVAAADDETDTRHRDAGEREVLRAGDRGGGVAVDPAQAKSRRRRLDRKAEFRRRRARQGAVERAAVDDEPRIVRAELRIHHRPPPDQRHRQFGDLAHLARGERRTRRRHGDCRDRTCP